MSLVIFSAPVGLKRVRLAFAVGRNRPGFLAKTLPSVGRILIFLCWEAEMSEALVLQGLRVFFEGFFTLRPLPFVWFLKRGELKKNLQVGSIYLRAKKKRVTSSPLFPFSFFFVSAGAADANTARKAVGEGASCSA